MNEFLKQTNSETKKIIINAFNLSDWLTQNKQEIQLNDKELSLTDIISISFFLSTIRHSNELKEIFEKYNISYQKYFELLKNQTQTDYEISPLDKTQIYQTYDFNIIKNDFLPRLKKRLDTTEKLEVQDIEIYQILYYFIDLL